MAALLFSTGRVNLSIMRISTSYVIRASLVNFKLKRTVAIFRTSGYGTSRK